MVRMTFVLVVAFLAGCASRGPSLVSESSHVDPKTGDLIALWMPMRDAAGRPDRLDPILVPAPYAVYVAWPNPEYDPDFAAHRIFIFYDNVAKRSYQTRDYDAFLAVLSRQPVGISIVQIDTCTLSRCYMPADQWARLEQTLKSRGMRLASDDVSESIRRFCYCEATGDFIYPGDK